MPFLVLIVALGLPFLELAVLIKVGQVIGVWRTLLILIGMAMLGAALLYWQGWSTLRRAQSALSRGEPPVEPMLSGMLLGVAGVFLLAPGLISDAIGLVLIIPPVRRFIARRILRRFLGVGDAGTPFRDDHRTTGRRSNGGGPVIEGEFERLDDKSSEQRNRPRR